jgi:hypothetical protein
MKARRNNAAWEVKKLQYLIPQLLCQEVNQGLHPSTSPKPPSHCVTKAPWSRDVTQIWNIICQTLRHSMPLGLHWNTQCLKYLGSLFILMFGITEMCLLLWYGHISMRLQRKLQNDSLKVNCYVNSCQTETNMKGMSVVITYQNMNFESWKKPPTKMPMFRLQHSYYKSMGQNISLGKDENNSK